MTRRIAYMFGGDTRPGISRLSLRETATGEVEVLVGGEVFMVCSAARVTLLKPMPMPMSQPGPYNKYSERGLSKLYRGDVGFMKLPTSLRPIMWGKATRKRLKPKRKK